MVTPPEAARDALSRKLRALGSSVTANAAYSRSQNRGSAKGSESWRDDEQRATDRRRRAQGPTGTAARARAAAPAGGRARRDEGHDGAARDRTGHDKTDADHPHRLLHP